MKRTSWLISRYLLGAVLPYFLFSWALLTVILFLQQASRYADLFFNVNLPSDLVSQLMIGLIPNVIAFTCPMAVLVGTVIGLSKMQGDSELIAIRAAGVGNWQIALPIALLGVFLSGFAFVVNIKGVPLAASIVRRVAMQSAISKFESPIEAGVFYSEIDNFTILARDTESDTGRLKNVFISQRDNSNGVFRFITSEIGRMDVEGEATELVLENAAVVTVPAGRDEKKYAFETIQDVRIALKTKRAEMLDRLSKAMKLPDELGLAELRDFADAATGKEKVEAEIIFQRRIVMSITPLIFCLLGTAMVLRFKRGGRGFGIFLALVGLIGYYLAAFLGEQLARTGRLLVVLAGLFPLGVSALAMAWFAYGPELAIGRRISAAFTDAVDRIQGRRRGLSIGNRLLDMTSGLRDFDIAGALIKYFLLTTGFLLAVFLIFTAFETWRFAAVLDNGTGILGRYLLYLTPFAYLQIAPSAAMIATLAAFAIRSRNNEIVTWASAGQSVFRLLMPCFVLALALGLVDFAIQETIAPRANRVQDDLRGVLRGGGPRDRGGRKWSIDGTKIYTWEAPAPIASVGLGDEGGKLISASDNEKGRRLEISEKGSARDGFTGSRGVETAEKPATAANRGTSDERSRLQGRSQNVLPMERSAEYREGGVAQDSGSPVSRMPVLATFGGGGIVASIISGSSPASDNEKRELPAGVRDVFVLELDGTGHRLQSIYRGDVGVFRNGRAELEGNAERIYSANGAVARERLGRVEFAAAADPFRTFSAKPNHMNLIELSDASSRTGSENERRAYDVGVQRRLASIFLPFVIVLFAAPWSISLRPVSMVPMLSAAVATWLVFIGTLNVFEQYALNSGIGIGIAVWAPLALFALFGVYLIGRVRS